MATIGKDGKDGSDGNEGGAFMAMMTRDTLPPLPVDKTMFRVDLTGIKSVGPDTQAKSDSFWETARGMGLLSASITQPNGDTVLFIPAANKSEVESLIKSDPLIIASAIASSSISEA